MRRQASFAALCGVNPIEASSGKTHRCRLNRGGDRRANAALYRIALTRSRGVPRLLVHAWLDGMGLLLPYSDLTHVPAGEHEQTRR